MLSVWRPSPVGLASAQKIALLDTAPKTDQEAMSPDKVLFPEDNDCLVWTPPVSNIHHRGDSRRDMRGAARTDECRFERTPDHGDSEDQNWFSLKGFKGSSLRPCSFSDVEDHEPEAPSSYEPASASTQVLDRQAAEERVSGAYFALRWGSLGGSRSAGEALWAQAEAALLGSGNTIVPGSKGIDGSASLVVFDWDDTLFPMSALYDSGQLWSPPPEGDDEELPRSISACAEAACKALNTARRYGRVVIVTNSVNGWVQEMVSRFMPSLQAELANVSTISAQSIYAPQGFSDPSSWKSLCFQRIALCLQNDLWTNAHKLRDLVSIGDSLCERAAAFEASADLGIPCFVKSVKFVDRPSIDDVTKQLTHLTKTFEWLMDHEGTLDLSLQPSGVLQPLTAHVQEGRMRATISAPGPAAKAMPVAGLVSGAQHDFGRGRSEISMGPADSSASSSA
eukprot:TRINITY_DN35000_c0_g2_i1.p1 TRINITY_DN35000_c0_g2~~TRINITY_DN35000_c0_g2_i1.p1  ORF type:complete len:452 (-),score=73.86 TRINITY_DN35000_c0_g2_i1:119-1474(-)